MARPLLAGVGPGSITAAGVSDALRPVQGHPMAKAAIEAAVLDAQLRAMNRSLAAALGATRDRVPAGVAVGIAGSIDELLTTVGRHLDTGYRRIKLKIAPGHDLEPVRAIRDRFGDGFLLTADANGAYTLADASALAALDPFGLSLIEQPLAADDLTGHAELARRLSTPICLDESIASPSDARRALDAGACSCICVKPGRVGGMLAAVEIHDLCMARGADAWVGGMLETGIGRAANLALAALPGFTLPGDLSATDRYFARDLTAPVVVDDGHIAVPTGPGLGIALDTGFLDEVTTWRTTLPIRPES
ncbi:MAG: o-succinylbenzoate synthase [Ilumatobacteraceae bacterium]